jgi:hypothetical protein
MAIEHLASRNKNHSHLLNKTIMVKKIKAQTHNPPSYEEAAVPPR